MTDPTDEEIMELMPQQMRDDLAAASRALAGFVGPKAASACRIILNRHAVDHARAAQAVLDAYGDFEPANVDAMAAALRAVADQVVPPALEEEFYDRNHALPLQKMVEIRQKLNAIAAELEANA